MTAIEKLQASLAGIDGAAIVELTWPSLSIRHVLFIESSSQSQSQSQTQSHSEILEVTFARAERPLQKLKVSQNGNVEFVGGRRKCAPDSFNVLSSTVSEDAVTFVHKHTKKGQEIRRYLALDLNGVFVLVESTDVESCVFILKVLKDNPLFSWGALELSTQDSVRLSLAPYQIERFRREGYLQIPSVIPKSQIQRCLKVLNHYLGVPGALIPGGSQTGLGKLGGKLTQHEAVLDLFSGKVLQWAEAFLGIGAINSSALNAQIAIRFPELEGSPQTNNCIWHTDGFRQGQTHGFSLLLGLMLSDVSEENSGNLCVWPGTHEMIHRCKHGHIGEIDFEALGHMLVDRIDTQEDAYASRLSEGKVPFIGHPLQLFGRAGDIVFLHPDLAHCGGTNLSPHIRTMIYFRLRCKPEIIGTDIHQRHLQDMWFDLPGVRDEVDAVSMEASV